MITKNPNIKGIGTDIIEITRIAQSIDRHGHHFLDKIFTKQEQDHCLKYKNPAPHFAGRFAAKEAISKALGTGFGEKLSWLDVEIVKTDQGKPLVLFSTEAKQRFQNPDILISISHCHSHATATAIWI